MSAVLYHHIFSTPSRTALLTIRNLGLNVQVKIVDIFNGEQHSPNYLKINPMNQIPAYVDGDFVLTESKAIATYLANSNKSLLYPSNYKRRALIDSKLYFDSTSFFPVIRDFYRPVIRAGAKKIDQQKRDDLKNMLMKLNLFLEKSKWFAGEELSIADLALLSNVGTVKCFGENFADFPALKNWFERCKLLPGFGENDQGAQALADKVAGELEEPLWKQD